MYKDLDQYAGTFDNVTKSGETLILRFHDGYSFGLKSDKPVIVLRAEGCEQIGTVHKDLIGFTGEEVDGLHITQEDERNKITVDFTWVNNGVPYNIIASKATLSYEKYTLEDHQKYIQILEKSWQKDRTTHKNLVSNIRHLREQLYEEIRRFRKKSDFFATLDLTKAECCKSTADALMNVITELEKCEQEGRITSEKEAKQNH